MINGFFNTIQADIVDLADAVRHSNRPRNEVQDRLIAMAVLRIFGTCIMAAGAFTVISAIPSLIYSPVSALFSGAIGTALYALGHDLFILARNHTNEIRNPLVIVEAGVKGIWNDFKKLFQGNQVQVGEGFTAERTKGTFFHPIWIKAFG